MNYPLTPAQKAILAGAGEDVNFVGDDNDFGCILSQITLRLFQEGKIVQAWNSYHHNPSACYGVTFPAWEASMKSMVIRHLENERSIKAHSN
jgi:hypothetical protein